MALPEGAGEGRSRVFGEERLEGGPLVKFNRKGIFMGRTFFLHQTIIKWLFAPLPLGKGKDSPKDTVF